MNATSNNGLVREAMNGPGYGFVLISDCGWVCPVGDATKVGDAKVTVALPANVRAQCVEASDPDFMRVESYRLRGHKRVDSIKEFFRITGNTQMESSVKLGYLNSQGATVRWTVKVEAKKSSPFSRIVAWRDR